MRKILESIIVGVIFGLFTQVLEKFVTSTEWFFLVETKVIWLIPAFLIAFNLPIRRWKKDAIIVSTITLLVTAFTYYSGIAIVGSQVYTVDEFLTALPALFVAGIVVGYVAYLARSATKDIIRYASVSLLPAYYTSGGIEGIINTINNFTWTPEIITELVGGLIFYLLISGNSRFKPKSGLSYLTLTTVATIILHML